MDIKNLKIIFERLVLLIETEPDKACSWFISEHKKLGYPEKDVLLPFIRRYYETICLNNSIPLENQLYLTEILNEIDDEFMGSGATNTVLTLKDLSILQITKLFYELKRRGFIVNMDIPRNVTTLFRGKVTTQSYSRFFIKKVTFISVDFC